MIIFFFKPTHGESGQYDGYFHVRAEVADAPDPVRDSGGSGLQRRGCGRRLRGGSDGNRHDARIVFGADMGVVAAVVGVVVGVVVFIGVVGSFHPRAVF